ncbi:MAG: hypothetical protein ACHQVK_04765 [Candidatus Paceibacterales bacterium]
MLTIFLLLAALASCIGFAFVSYAELNLEYGISYKDTLKELLGKAR